MQAKLPLLSRYSEEYVKEVLSNNADAAAKVLLNISSVTLYRRKFNIKSPHDYAAFARKFHLNHNFFENIDTEEKAYILGFMAADGNVNPNKYGCELRIVLHPKDVDILEKINASWESTYPVRDHKLGLASGYPGSSKLQKKLSICSSKMQIDLAKYGVIPNKTASLRFPKLPNELDRHFLRGFLDGDGYINHEAFGWTSNEYMCNDIQWICIKHGFKELKRYRIKESSSTVRGTPVHLDIIKWIYDDATIYLNRKHLEYVAHWQNRIHKIPCRPNFPSTKHVPCALEVLPPGQGSIP